MPTTTQTHVAVIPSQAYRVVLFGMPDAGKSSLLGALAQAAQVQEPVLGGTLIDKSQGLVELQRRLYEDRPRQTLEEIVPFPIRLEPLGTKKASSEPDLDAVLLDCDGRVAGELLAHKDSLTGDLSKRALAQAVLGADALVLAMDVSADLAHLKRDFGQFARFIRTLERGRGRRVEIAGMPVYLVLTKCDLLAKAEDSAAEWAESIEERKKQVGQRFREFLDQQAEREHMAFGKIDLHVRATAVRRPALADAPARPKEPFGVAELFRQALSAARTFREKQLNAGERLSWTVGLLGILVTFLTLLGLFFLVTQSESDQVRLEKELKGHRDMNSDGAAARLREPLSRTVKDLQAFQENPLLDKMPPDLQKYVADYLQEAQAYQKYVTDFEKQIKVERLPEAPRKARNDAELEAFRKLLDEHPLPEKYRNDWGSTDMARKHRQWQDELEVMSSEVKAALKTFAELDELDKKIRDRASYTGSQLDLFVSELKYRDKTLPYRVDNQSQVRKSRVTYSDVAQFAPVALKIEDYEVIRRRHQLDKGK